MEDKKNIKKIISLEDIFRQKLSGFANYAVDPQIRQILNQRSEKSFNNKKELENILNLMEE